MLSVFVVFFMLLPLCGITQNDSAAVASDTSEWSTSEYTQEDKIFNRSVWTFADNPALAGFDRKLAVAYRFRMKNLSMGTPDGEESLKLGFLKHEAFLDLSVGGSKQNWGAALYYSHEQELHHTIQQVILASSHRIQFNKHQLILGVLAGYRFPDIGEWSVFTFRDMYDPRLGLAYTTNEERRTGGLRFAFFGGGMKYVWKRLSVDYSVVETSSDGFAILWAGTTTVRNRFKVNYHLHVGDEVTISPELVGELRSRHLFDPNSASHNGFFSAFATVTYRDLAYGQIGVREFSRMTFRAGYQLKDFLVVELGVGSYLDKTMRKIAGLATAEIGIRYQVRPWYR